ncbi:MAG: energy-coupling factor transporter transmembrane component T [Chloroflexota bacterium]
MARRLPDFVARPQQGRYCSLNPTTKLVVALTMALIALGVRGWSPPLLVLGVMLLLVIWAGVGRRYLPYLLASTPLLISIVLINTFLYPARDVAFAVGPFVATGSGISAAGQAALRVLAFATSVALFALTTRTDELVDDLERRGLGRRGAFIVGTAIGTVPRMVERAREIVEAQRARGLDTQGGVLARVRGLLPLSGPLVLSALSEVEQRTMALEARAFSASGRRTVLRPYPDSGAQRALRWGVTLLALGLLAGELAGTLNWLP